MTILFIALLGLVGLALWSVARQQPKISAWIVIGAILGAGFIGFEAATYRVEKRYHGLLNRGVANPLRAALSQLSLLCERGESVRAANLAHQLELSVPTMTVVWLGPDSSIYQVEIDRILRENRRGANGSEGSTLKMTVDDGTE